MDRSSRFWDRMAQRYSRKPVVDEAAYQRKLEVTREHFRPDMEVLELGCGTGSTAIAHSPHVKHIHAVDSSSKMIDIARRKAEAQNITNITFECSTIEDVTAADGTLDAVLALSVLHLLEDREAVIRKAHRMLKPHGIFVTSTPCIADTMRWFGPIAAIGRCLGLIPLIRVFTAKELEESLRAAGFSLSFRWQPGKGKALFIVGTKRADAQQPVHE